MRIVETNSALQQRTMVGTCEEADAGWSCSSSLRVNHWFHWFSYCYFSFLLHLSQPWHWLCLHVYVYLFGCLLFLFFWGLQVHHCLWIWDDGIKLNIPLYPPNEIHLNILNKNTNFQHLESLWVKYNEKCKYLQCMEIYMLQNCICETKILNLVWISVTMADMLSFLRRSPNCS